MTTTVDFSSLLNDLEAESSLREVRSRCLMVLRPALADR